MFLLVLLQPVMFPVVLCLFVLNDRVLHPAPSIFTFLQVVTATAGKNSLADVNDGSLVCLLSGRCLHGAPS